MRNRSDGTFRRPPFNPGEKSIYVDFTMRKITLNAVGGSGGQKENVPETLDTRTALDNSNIILKFN